MTIIELTRENRVKITALWFNKDLQSMSNEDLLLLKEATKIGFVPMSDYFDQINRITWNQRMLDVETEIEKRGL